MRVLVTGAGGQLGRCLLDKQGEMHYFGLSRQELDISDREAVFSAIKQSRPDIVVNAAAYTAVDAAQDNESEATQINVDGPENLAMATACQAIPLIHISTDYVFHRIPTGQGHMEDDDKNPVSVYGKTKSLGEEKIFQHTDYGCIIRTAWVYSEYGSNFVKTMLRVGKERPELKVVNDQVGNPTYAGDIATAIELIAPQLIEKDNGLYGTYHFAGSQSLSWAQFAQSIFDEAVRQDWPYSRPQIQPISSSEYNAPAPRPPNSTLNCEKIKTHFGVINNDSDSLSGVIAKLLN